MIEQVEVQEALNERLIELRGKNPGFSMRAFSKRLGISSSALSEILSGKRKISKKMAAKIATRMDLTPEEIVLKGLGVPKEQMKTEKWG